MKTLTVESISAELIALYHQIEMGGLEPEDQRELNMKLAVLKQGADLVKSNILEIRVDELMRLATAHAERRRLS